ncbi:CCAAT/enhancer-binding protein zeta-like isoform X2 [Patiria miniata]|uniref:CCAAT/enhancer-binding protein zeta n=1 Tax=Patiria miniata TaxID=46514 RepID=A0A914B8H1_PATMI|nr:CCAAT/enhancer-binding protein zeta-like isoform X2 [Patiria miniata]
MESTTDQKRAPKEKRKSVKFKTQKKRKQLEKLTLQDIEAIGGNEDDLRLIGDISESDEEEVSQTEEEQDIDPQELKAYFQSLGFQNVSADGDFDSPKDDDNPPGTSKSDNKQDRKKDKLTKKEKKAEKKKLKSEPDASLKDAKTSKETSQDETVPAKKVQDCKKPTGGVSDAKSLGKKPLVNAGAVLQHSEVSSTSSESHAHHQQVPKRQISAQKLLEDFTPRKQLLFEPEGLCYYREFQSDPKKFELSDDATVAAYRTLAGRLYSNEVQIYLSKKKGDLSTKAQWMQTVVSSGVLSDKVAALTLEVQTAPVHTPASLDSLMTMLKKKGRRETLVAMDALKQLFLQELLPERRKLRLFSQHPFSLLNDLSEGKRPERNKRLLLWYCEDQLKQKYLEFVKTLEKLSHDTIQAVKQKAMSTSHEMLSHKPEQEKALLTLLVNKIGDPDYKIAARAVHLLQKLVEVHTTMKGVVVTEVEALLYRANVSSKAQYYAVCFLNQLILSHDEPDLATKLIVVYFSFFKACMKKRNADQKMLGAVLTGVNRAYPYSNVGDERVGEQTDSLFKVVHIAPFNTSIQALLLLKQVLDTRQAISDRFYSALYSKLLDRSLENSPRQAMFLNLLYQSMKADAIIGRIKAFVKRLLQMCSTQQPPFVCGALFLISEIMDIRPALRSAAMDAMDSDDEEHFVDIDEEDDARTDKKGETDVEKDASKSASSWVHHKIENPDKKTQYDPTNRNPQFSGAEGSVFWELTKLQNHYHPSVALFAKTIREGLKVHYMGNPLQDFTQMRFLDRFVYRNPKKQTEKVKVSIMEPKGKSYKPSAIRLMAVNTKDYLKTAQEKIPIDELFFHKYFTSKGKKPQQVTDRKKEKSVKEDDDDEDDFEFDSDASSVDDDEFDRILETVDLEDTDEDDDDDDDDVMDFAGEVKRKKKDKTTKQKGKASEDDSSESEEDFDYPDDEDEGSEIGEDNFDSTDDDQDDDDNDDEFKIANDEFDEEGFGESDSAEEHPSPAKATKRKTKKPTRQADADKDSDSEREMDFLGAMGTGKRKGGAAKRGGKKRRKVEGAGQSGGSLQATAEEFSSLMDDHVGAKFDSIGLNAMANKDNADAKQLNWEIRRDKWVQGRDPKSMMLAKKKGKFPKGKPFQKGQGRQLKKGGSSAGGKANRKRSSKR